MSDCCVLTQVHYSEGRTIQKLPTNFRVMPNIGFFRPMFRHYKAIYSFQIAHVSETRQLGTMSITPAILAQLPLPDIDAVLFYKRDEITTDLICCDVEIAGRTWTFHEETKGWKKLISHLSALPNFRADWYETVVNPPFATCETIAFKRR